MTTRHLLPILALAITATACSQLDTDAVRTVPTPTSPDSTAPTPPDRSTSGSPSGTSTPAPAVSEATVDATLSPSSSAAPPATTSDLPLGDPEVAATFVAAFEQPVGLAVRPGDTAIYIVEQDGRIVRAELRFGGVAEQRIVIDLTDATGADGERGLLGLAFAPTGDQAWVHYTDNDGDTVVAEYPVAADGTFVAGAGRTVLTVDQPYANHNGGDLAVGPDGMLYVALGDGGSANDPERRASDPTDLLGKLLRIDPAGGDPYAIPPDNPFATGPGPGGLDGAPEVWAWGLRNPWRIAFDPANGDLWIADVGQNVWEEVDHVVAADGRPAGWAADFGWSAYEGDLRFNDDVADPGNFVFPVHVYEHGEDGCSVSGGAVYRGRDIPALVGMYVYSDFCSGRLWAYAAATDRNLTLLDGFEQVTAVRPGPQAELYVLELSGDVYRIDPVT
jgi:glucose/arabinose dehydrogenase